MVHRSDLEDPNVLKAYERSYQQLLTFFHEHM